MIRLGHRQSSIPYTPAIQINRNSPQLANLVGCWPYSPSAYFTFIKDWVGTNNATLAGTHLWGQSDNELGFGDYLPGNGDGYADCGNTPELQITTGGLTVCIWVRMYQSLGGGGWPGLIAKGDVDTTTASYNMYLGTNNTLRFQNWSGGAARNNIIGATSMDYQKTYHLAATWLPSTRVSVFVNGIQDATSTTSISATLDNPNYNLLIGSQQKGANKAYYQFRGIIYEARIYNRALSEDEIYQLWNPPTRWDLYRSPIRYFGKAIAGSTGRVFGPAAQAF